MYDFVVVDVGFWFDVYDLVGCFDGFFVVFDYDQCVVEVVEGEQGFDEVLVVVLVQFDGWFVEYVQYFGQVGVDLCGQLDVLCFVVGERVGGMVEVQV